MHESAHARWSEEGWDAGTACAALLCQSTLWDELHLELASQVLPLEFFILAHVGGNHPLNLTLVKHETQAEIVDTAIVRDDRVVSRSLLDHGTDQVLRDATETETANKQRVTRLDVLDCLLCAREDLLSEASLHAARSEERAP